jgi:hypothetical protein
MATMATYQDLSMSIAGEVASGALAPGDVLSASVPLRPATRDHYRHGRTRLPAAGGRGRDRDRRPPPGQGRDGRPAAAMRLLDAGRGPRQGPAPAAEPLQSAAAALRLAVRDPAVQESVSALGGYDVPRAGTVRLIG